MKKLSVMLLALTGLFIFTGCSDSPKDVVVKWTEAIVNGDIKKANEYSTENTHALNGMIIGIVNGKSGEAAYHQGWIGEMFSNNFNDKDYMWLVVIVLLVVVLILATGPAVTYPAPTFDKRHDTG